MMQPSRGPTRRAGSPESDGIYTAEGAVVGQSLPVRSHVAIAVRIEIFVIGGEGLGDRSVEGDGAIAQVDAA